ncbi:MAG: hypothetical protein JRN51_06290 [Nitrososphaerota archaeon]|nr:hypothetical protein [Nitrososphaerota archaeon]MDG7031004.1 hypothetical protein [Nitrososphaerota archaeon]
MHDFDKIGEGFNATENVARSVVGSAESSFMRQRALVGCRQVTRAHIYSRHITDEDGLTDPLIPQFQLTI